MLNQVLIHPEINAVLARAGHHARILIADGNYPCSTKRGPNAALVSLNLMPDVVTCTDVLRALLASAPIEAIHTMGYETEGPYALAEPPAAWADYRRAVAAAGLDLPLEPIFKWDFYAAVATPDHALTIQTGDRRPFANLLLTLGVRRAGDPA